MAKRRAKKRQGANQPSQPNIEPAPEIEQHPPEVDDSSVKPLTTESLKELNRQNFRPSPPLLSPSDTSRVVHFAELGGPDLSDLRGYQLPRNFFAMATDLRSFLPPTNAVLVPKPPTLGALLFKYNIHPASWSQPLDLRSLHDTLAVPRPSVSPLTVSDDAYEIFRKNVRAAKNGRELSFQLIPALMGNEYPINRFALDAPFATMDPLGADIPAAQPDLYCGEFPHHSLHRTVREALAKHINPAMSYMLPIVPNFFFECQDLDFAERDMKSRAQHDGAFGARAIHSLQNYGNEEPEYDNQPYTFSATYHEGVLVLYAHHVTKPCSEGELPDYHMNEIRKIDLLASRESFIEGITAFRNARDEAQKHRARFIAAANRIRSNQQAEKDAQIQQLRIALQHPNASSDAVRQLMEFVQQARPQPAAATAASSYQAAQPSQAMLQQPAAASAAPLHQTTQLFQAMLQESAAAGAAPLQLTTQAAQAMLQPPAITSAGPFLPTTQALHAMPQPPAATSSDPLRPGPEDGQHLNKGPTPMPLGLPLATNTSQKAVPSQTATNRKRPGPSQDAPSRPSGKKTRTGRKY